AALGGPPPGHGRSTSPGAASRDEAPAAPPAAARWSDDGGRELFPLPFPELTVDEGVVVPNQASLLVWKHLWRERVGAGARCLDIGCGSGIQAVTLALNGATSVDALDI